MIYLLEDDDSIRELVCYSLNKTGNKTLGFSSPAAFWTEMEKTLPDLVLLDVMLPEEDGLTVLSKIRSKPGCSSLPVIMLTAKSSEYDKVMALDNGADDYITKPFGVMELVARVKAVLRRAGTAGEEDGKVYRAGELSVSLPRHVVTVNGEEVTLTLKEFELLAVLFANRGTVLTRNQLLSSIWGYEFDGENRTVDVHIRTLRQKLGGASRWIETIRGVGYKIPEDDQ